MTNETFVTLPAVASHPVSKRKCNKTNMAKKKNKIWKFYYDRNFRKMSATTAALRRGLEFGVLHSSEGVSTISLLGSSSFAFTSIGYKCFTLLLIKRGLLSLFATLTIAALTKPSLPVNSSSTLASFQNIRFDESLFRITISPTAISGPRRIVDLRA